MVSHAGTSFAQDMGYFAEEGDDAGWQPGISAFRKDGERIIRVSDTPLGPGDLFCAAWHMFDLLPDAADGWELLLQRLKKVGVESHRDQQRHRVALTF